MSFTSYYERESLAEKPLEDVRCCYLLNGEFCIVSAYTGEENAPTGTSFFDLFPANRISREEIASYIRSYPQDVLLTLCARMPVLFVGTLFAQTGLILAVLPKGEIKKTLAAPAAFHHVPAHVCVSLSAQARHKAHDEAAFSRACRWLIGASAPFLHPQNGDLPLAALLSARVERLAALLNMSISCDFSGLPALSARGVDVAFALGVMLATLWAAGRASREKVRLYAAMEGSPTLYLEYRRVEDTRELPEFSALLGVAAARGAVLDVVVPNRDPYLVQVRAGIGVIELSAQGVRERHRFLEGKSPLAKFSSATSISPAFPELSFD